MKKDNNLNLVFAGIFFFFSVMFFLLWWFKNTFSLPAAIIFLIIGLILVIFNSKLNNLPTSGPVATNTASKGDSKTAAIKRKSKTRK